MQRKLANLITSAQMFFTLGCFLCSSSGYRKCTFCAALPLAASLRVCELFAPLRFANIYDLLRGAGARSFLQPAVCTSLFLRASAHGATSESMADTGKIRGMKEVVWCLNSWNILWNSWSHSFAECQNQSLRSMDDIWPPIWLTQALLSGMKSCDFWAGQLFVYLHLFFIRVV